MSCGLGGDEMTQAERVRQYFRENPRSPLKEAAKELGIDYSTVRVYIHKDTKAGRCIRTEDGTIDYSGHFQADEALAELMVWKNETRREWVDMLTKAAEKETDPNTMRLLIKEANSLMREVIR